MKRCKLLILLFLGLFLNIIEVKAETFKRTNIDNGKISISLNSNKGYVGAIDATIKLTGNVSLSKLEWNSSLKDLAMRDYKYDQKNNTIRIFLVTKNTNQNLLDKSGNLNIGNIVVTSNKTETYDVKLDKISITNFDLVKSEITSDSITSTGDKNFTIQLETTPSPSVTVSPSSTAKPSNTNDSSKSDNQTTNNKDDENREDNDDTTNNNVDDKSNNDNQIENNKKEETESNKKDKEKLPIVLIIVGAIVALILIVSVIIYIVKKNRKLDDIVESQIIEKE